MQIRAGAGGFASGALDGKTGVTVTSLSSIAIDSVSQGLARQGAFVMVAQDGISTKGTAADTRQFSFANSADIVLISGASFTETDTEITITGASAGATSGMDLNFGNFGLATVNASNTAGDNGGNITILSYMGASGSADVSLGSGSQGKILSGGNGAGKANGDITIVSAQASGVAITGGIIDPTGGDAGSGNVTLANSNPGTNLVIDKATGAIAGDVLGGALQNGTFSPQSIAVDNGDLTFHGGSLTDVPTYTGTADHLSIKSGSNFAPASPISAGSLDIQTTGTVNLGTTITLTDNLAVTAGNSITVNTDLVAPGGILLVSGQDITTGSAGLDIDAGSSTGAGGNITAIAGAQFTELNDTVTVSGPSVTGGKIDFKTSALTNLKTSSTNTDSAGGDITLCFCRH